MKCARAVCSNPATSGYHSDTSGRRYCEPCRRLINETNRVDALALGCWPLIPPWTPGLLALVNLTRIPLSTDWLVGMAVFVPQQHVPGTTWIEDVDWQHVTIGIILSTDDDKPRILLDGVERSDFPVEQLWVPRKPLGPAASRTGQPYMASGAT